MADPIIKPTYIIGPHSAVNECPYHVFYITLTVHKHKVNQLAYTCIVYTSMAVLSVSLSGWQESVVHIMSSYS